MMKFILGVCIGALLVAAVATSFNEISCDDKAAHSEPGKWP